MTHKGARNDLTAEYVRSILDYDPETGVLTWKIRRKGIQIGAIAGCRQPRGYISVGIDKKHYRAHRLIWLIMTNDWPDDEIDHRDGDPSNNCWNNLRAATRSQNCSNSARKNSHGYKGVHFFKRAGRYQAYVTLNRKREHIGYFDTAEDAFKAYCKRARELHGEFHSPY